MKIALAHLKSASPYSQGRPVQSSKDRNETHEKFEERTWRERMHVNEQGNVFIPPMSFKNAISEAAKYKSVQIPGKGKSTYTKHFEAGVLCKEPLDLGVKAVDVPCDSVFVPVGGERGGGKRVWKTFPIIMEWSGVVEFLILDEIITEEVFTTHLIDAGSFIGVGRFRPRNNGYYGRFSVEKVEFGK